MSAFLFIIGLLLWALAAITFMGAPAVTQQIAGIEIGVAGCVMIGGGAVVDAVDKVGKNLERAYPNASKGKPAEEFHA